MTLFIAILLCGLGLANAADTNKTRNDPTAFIHGQEYPVSTNEARPFLIWTGSNSKVMERGCFRITTREEWTDLWLRHTGQSAPALYRSGQFNHWAVPDGVPQVDFTRCVVVAVFQGPKSDSAGFDIAGVVDQGEATMLRLVERWSQSAASSEPTPPVPISVFGLFVLPRSNRPLVVEESVQHHLGKPLIWKEHVRFAPLSVSRRVDK
jgi:hypothetical protein